ncbi:MAG: GNAT family N-acetyltransferase [Acidobacteriota bacterium]
MHDRSTFACGEVALDLYLRTQVTQDIRRHITNCFIAVDTLSGHVAGYYTLAATSIPLTNLPQSLAKRLPRYPAVPAVRIGRLAIDQQFQGRGLGAASLSNAAKRTLDAPPAAYALVVDAKNDHAIAFYRHHGFVSFADHPNSLFLPLATFIKASLS